MRKNRLEAFTDGVMAIVITLLILDVKLPEVEYGGLAGGLIAILPKISVYAQSFLLIGLYWVFHHQSFNFINEVDGVLLWINVLFLLLISFLPFPTAMMGKYHYQTMPLVIYCANIMLVNLTGFIMLFYLRRNPQLASPLFTDKTFRTLHQRQCRVCALRGTGFYSARLQQCPTGYFSPVSGIPFDPANGHREVCDIGR